MALSSSPFDLCVSITQNHYAFTVAGVYSRSGETDIDPIVIAEGQTTADMLETYNMITPQLISVWYVQQDLIDFGAGQVPPRAGDKITVPDGTVYHVESYEPQQGNIDWRLITRRESV